MQRQVLTSSGCPLQSASIIYLARVALTVSETVPITPKTRRFHRIDMYRLYTYRSRESLREAFSDCQTYRTSMSMHTMASYTRRAVGVINQCSTEVVRCLGKRAGRTCNNHINVVGCSPTQMHLSYTPKRPNQTNLHALIHSNKL